MLIWNLLERNKSIILHGLERGTKYHVTQAQDNITYILFKEKKIIMFQMFESKVCIA